jgi:hypothetical protein
MGDRGGGRESGGMEGKSERSFFRGGSVVVVAMVAEDSVVV